MTDIKCHVSATLAFGSKNLRFSYFRVLKFQKSRSQSGTALKCYCLTSDV